MHVHPDPDVFGRALTDIELVTVARRKGMRGIVIKNHVVSTADRAALAMQQVPGIEVWGGIVLNNSVGGINPMAVEWCIACPALKIVARENLILATGHIHAEEVVGMGGMIEICYLQFMTGPNAQYAWMKHWKQVGTDKVVEAVRELGADNLVLSADLGQQGMMMPPDGIENAAAALRAAGISQADIDKMMKRNPAKLLGLSTRACRHIEPSGINPGRLPVA